MKNILTYSFILLTSSFMLAHATPNYWLAINSEAYTKDTSPSANTTSYAAYYCTVEAAEEMFGGKSTVAGITAYLVQNFTTGQTALQDNDAELREGNAYVQTLDYDTLANQYVFTDGFVNALATGDYLAILLYQNGDNKAVRVLGNADWTEGNVVFDSQAEGTVGAWSTVPVPEPTSALLLLFGLVGLALKRKN